MSLSIRALEIYQNIRESSQACEAGSTPVSRSNTDNQQLTSFFTIKNIVKSIIFTHKIGTKTCIMYANASSFVSNM